MNHCYPKEKFKHRRIQKAENGMTHLGRLVLKGGFPRLNETLQLQYLYVAECSQCTPRLQKATGQNTVRRQRKSDNTRKHPQHRRPAIRTLLQETDAQCTKNTPIICTKHKHTSHTNLAYARAPNLGSILCLRSFRVESRGKCCRPSLRF